MKRLLLTLFVAVLSISLYANNYIYMFLRLSTPKTLSDIEDFTSEEFNDLKINFQ